MDIKGDGVSMRMFVSFTLVDLHVHFEFSYKIGLLRDVESVHDVLENVVKAEGNTRAKIKLELELLD